MADTAAKVAKGQGLPIVVTFAGPLIDASVMCLTRYRGNPRRIIL